MVLPEDTYQVVINDIVQEEQKKYNSDEIEEVFRFQFKVVEEGVCYGEKLIKSVRPILSEGFEGGNPSWLYRIYEAAGLSVNPEKEIKAEDVNSLIGKQIRLIVKVVEKEGKKYNKITDILKAKKAIDEDQEIDPKVPF